MTTIDTIPGRGPGSPTITRNPRADYVRKVVVGVWPAVEWFEHQLEKRRSRLALLELNDDQLKDVGISWADAYREGLRSFWD